MTNINSNILALRRKRLGYEQKHVAVLLGHKNTYQISRYETGQRTPGITDAIKLSILYGLPIRTLFERYFRRCEEELMSSMTQYGLKGKIISQNMSDIDKCSYLEMMNSTHISQRDADKIRHHIKVLMEERSKKILGG